MSHSPPLLGSAWALGISPAGLCRALARPLRLLQRAAATVRFWLMRYGLTVLSGHDGSSSRWGATVLKVVDGDTIDIRDDVRGRLRMRVLGIDTPETKKPGYTVGCWGPEATEFAQSTMVGQRVAFVPDPTQDQTDRYCRTLAYLIRVDGWDYSVEAARAGAAKSYVYEGNPVAGNDAIVAAEREAREAQRCHGETESVPR